MNVHPELRNGSGLASSPGLPLAPHNTNYNNFALGGEGLGTRLGLVYETKEGLDPGDVP